MNPCTCKFGFGLLPLLRKSEYNSCIVTAIRVRSNDQITIGSDKNIKINTECFLLLIWLHNDEINFWIPFKMPLFPGLKLIATWHIYSPIDLPFLWKMFSFISMIDNIDISQSSFHSQWSMIQYDRGTALVQKSLRRIPAQARNIKPYRDRNLLKYVDVHLASLFV